MYCIEIHQKVKIMVYVYIRTTIIDYVFDYPM